MTLSLVYPRKENIQLPTGESCERTTETCCDRSVERAITLVTNGILQRERDTHYQAPNSLRVC